MGTLAELEMRARQLLTRALLLERALHDRRPWFAVVRDACGDDVGPFPLERQVLPEEGSVVFVTYLKGDFCSGQSVTVWCRGEILSVIPLEGQAGPLRLRWTLGLPETETISD